ncbi:MAG: type II secretion system protein [Candidatus Omnitrophica bacterium]|nr:type II secretion system protein [Candidatus Omnitrophota bacterium]
MKRARATGFTLMELLIVVIIVGILAAVALPQFARMTRRARAAEATTTVGAILTAEWVYYQENAAFVGFADNAALKASPLLVDVADDASSSFDYAAAAGPPAVVTATADVTNVSGIVVTGTIQKDGTRQVSTTGL